jgi:hypothetical protein
VLFSYNAPDASHFHQVLASQFRALLPPPTNPQWETYVWHNVQTTITMLTAALGAVVGYLLAARSERAAATARDPDGSNRPRP